MSSDGIAERWQSARPMADVRRSLISKVEQRGHGEVLSASADRISADFGSHVAFRLKGALIAKPNEFPIHGEIVLTDAGAGTTVEVRLTEAMGFGVKAGSRKKYESALEDLARFMRSGLEGTPAPSTEPQADPVAQSAAPSVTPAAVPEQVQAQAPTPSRPSADDGWREIATKWQGLNHGGAIRALEGATSPAERVLAVVAASTPGAIPKKGLLAFTDARVLFAGGTGGLNASVLVAESKLSVESIRVGPGSFGMKKLVIRTQTNAHDFVVERGAEADLAGVTDWPIDIASENTASENTASPPPVQMPEKSTSPVPPEHRPTRSTSAPIAPSAEGTAKRNLVLGLVAAVIALVVIALVAGSGSGSASLKSCSDFNAASAGDQEAFATRFIDRFDVGSPDADVLAGLVGVACRGIDANRADEDTLMFLTASAFDLAREGSPDFYFVSSTNGESDLRRCLRDAEC